MVGWLGNQRPFQYNNRLYWDKVEIYFRQVKNGQRYSNLPTSLPFVQRRPKMVKEAHLSYYASAYNRLETNQPPQDQCISSM